MSTEEAREEIRARHAVAVQREEKRQAVEQIALEEGIPLEFCANVDNVQTDGSPVLSDKDLEDLVLQQSRTYRERLLFWGVDSR